MVHDLWGDYEGGKIADGIEINLTGGEVFSINAFDGRNSSLDENEDASVVVNMSGCTVYNMVGQYSMLRDGVSSEINFSASEDGDPIYVGYLIGFHEVNLGEDANVVIDAEKVMDVFKIEYSKYGASSDQPFYKMCTT